MNDRRGGVRCIARNCDSSTISKTEFLKFHRFPKDETMCKIWIGACGREELLETKLIGDFYKNYRVCSKHFENEMYNNPFEKSRLLPNAEPTKFKEIYNLKDSDREPWSMKIPKIEDTSDIDIKEEISLLEVCSSDIQTDSYSQPCSKKIPKLEDTSDIDVKEEILLEVSSTEEESASATERLDCLSPFSYSFRELDSSTESIQAPVILSSDTPQVINLKNDFGGLQNENYRLRRLLKECKSKLQETNEEFLEGVTLEDYMNLTFKFCRGNIELAHFINVQVSDLASEDE
ncbi:hypothetical protein JTB14_032113 [Gonioctena quinquepunctata]|nr:hypothetical protein JTB14_032113 [Gonioctena quinquepunctata]